MNESQAGFYTDLCCSTKLDQEVLDELISELILTFEDREDILHQSTQRERNETLLDILSSRPYDTTCYLADALNNCNHTLSNMVKLSAKKEVFIKGKDTDASMVQIHKIKLQKNFKKIVHSVGFTTGILDYLISQATITKEEQENICKEGITRQESNRRLLSTLVYQDDKAFNQFIAALNTDEYYMEIANNIQSTEISLEEIRLYKIGIESSKERKHIERSIPRNIREKIKIKIKKWKVQDQQFVSTRAADHVLQCINHEACVVVSGNSGCGKTFTAHHVALEMKEKGYYIVPTVKPEDITNYIIPNIKMLFVVDDLCGKFTVNHMELNEWCSVLKDLDEMENNDRIKVLATCRLQIFRDERLKDLSLFQNCECNLISNELLMSYEEKRELTKQYFGTNIDNIKHLEKYDFFPFLCQLYGRNTHIDVHPLSENPFGIFQEELNKLQRGDDDGKLKYCSLLLCVLLNNTLKVKDLDYISNDLQQIVAATLKICRLNKGTQESSILEAMRVLESTYVKFEDESIVIVHDKLFDFLAKYFGEKHTALCLKHAHPQIIKERFNLYDIQRGNNDLIKLPLDYAKSYIERLINIWEKMGIGYILGNENIKSERFFSEFIDQVNELPEYRIKLLVNQQSDDAIPLVEACRYDNKHFVRWMLSIKISSNKLYYKQSVGRIDGAPFLDVNVFDTKGMSPLYAACCCRGDPYIVIELLKHSSLDVNIRNSMGWSPLYVTCYDGNIDKLKALLKHPFLDINLCDEDGCSPLFVACFRGNAETVIELLKHPSVDVNLSDNNGSTPLHAACSNGNIRTAIELLKYPTLDLNLCDIDGCSALVAACLNGNTEIVVELLKHPSLDINLSDNNISSPLYASSFTGNADTVSELLKHPLVKVNLCDKDGCSPLYAACFNGNVFTIRELLKHPSLDVNLCTINGETPLFVACTLSIEMSCIGKVKELLKHPLLNPNICNRYGKSPLHVAVENGDLVTVSELVKHPSIDINLVDLDGHSPIYYAYEQGDFEIVSLLTLCRLDAQTE